MRAVIQAVSSASVRVNGGEPRAIGPGLMILLGVKDTDSLDIVPKLADKCAGLRIFPDAEGKLNLSARDLGYSALVVSQFTLYGDTKKGYRPSFIKAAKPPLSVDAYELFLAEMNKQGLKDVQHGEFGADMQVSLVPSSLTPTSGKRRSDPMQAFHIPAPPPYYTNTFLLISDAGHAVIIDPAADVQNYEQILQEHNAVLTTLLCTHGHFDHVGSAEALRRKYHAVLYCEADDLAGDKMYPLSEADHGYAEGQTVTVDELQFTAWHTPGHTPGSVVLLCGEYLFCGDTLFAGSIGRTDLEGGSSDAMNASLRKLAKLPIPWETQVLPGHGEFSTFGEELDNNYFIRSAQRGNADF